MARSVSLRGSDIKIYVGGKLFPPAQSLSYTINYGEQEIYGIDSVFPQEIVTTRISVSGSVRGVVLKGQGGLQYYDLRCKIENILKDKYISLRLKDRHRDIDFLWIPQIKVTAEQFQVDAKGVARLSFNFKGIIPYTAIDTGRIPKN
jgi:hypothetical protein